LISNLSSEYERASGQISDKIIGNIDFDKTSKLRATKPISLVCSINIKNILTPENLLLGAVIVSINLFAIKFLKDVNGVQIRSDGSGNGAVPQTGNQQYDSAANHGTTNR
jgi:hypothetical protein